MTLHTPTGNPDLFPAFLPTNDAVVFEHEVTPPNPDEFGATRDGARGELWWVDLKTQTAAPLVAAAQAQSLPLRVVDIAQREIAALYERGLVLVRPDGHVAWRGDAVPSDPAGLVRTVRGAA